MTPAERVRVLLMVERDGRVVSVGGAFSEIWWRRCGEKMHEVYRDTVGLGAVRLAFMYGKWAASLLAADRWWLVEADSADAARAVIKLYGEFRSEAPYGAVRAYEGRILASGGKP